MLWFDLRVNKGLPFNLYIMQSNHVTSESLDYTIKSYGFILHKILSFFEEQISSLLR